MQNFTTDAINLKSYNLSESDKIIVLYSKDKGIMRCVAKGVKKTTSKLGGRMDMLIANKLMLHKGKNLDTICQAEAINTFKNTRNDLNNKECKNRTIGAIKLHNKLRLFLLTLLQLDYNTKSRYEELANEKVCDFCFNLLKNYVEEYSPKKIKSAQMLEFTK